MKSRAYKFWRFLLVGIVRIIFFVIPVNRKNEPKLSDGPYLVCSNHLHATDPIVICSVVKHQQPRFMAKKELFSVPVLKHIIKGLGAYPVDRSGKDGGVLVKTVRMLNDGYCVGMFPQGTRRPGVDPASTPVKRGAGVICEHSKVQVLPVYLKTKENKRRLFKPVRVIVGKPIPYEEYTAGGHEHDAQYISEYIFGKICALGSDAEGGGRAEK